MNDNNNEARGLRHYIAIVEAEQPNWAQRLGGGIRDTAGWIGDRGKEALGAVADAGKIIYNAAGQVVNTAGDVVSGALYGPEEAQRRKEADAQRAAAQAATAERLRQSSANAQAAFRAPQAPATGAGGGDREGEAAAQANQAARTAPAATTPPAPGQTSASGANDGDAGEAAAQANQARTQAARTAPAATPAANAQRPGMLPGGTAAIYDQQKALVAKGARIATDGIMGPLTQAAMAQFGGTAAAPAAQAARPQAAPAPAPRAADGGPAPTPAQLKWLGGANPNDPYILNRMRRAVPNTPPPARPQAAPAPASEPIYNESTYVEDQSLARIVSLVNYSNK